MQNVHALVHRLNNPDLGILCIRIALGAVFIYHGWAKIGSMEQTIGFFASLGFASFLAYFVAWAELIGGIALVAGFLVRYAGILLSAVMVVAVVKVHLANGFNVATGGYEFALTLLLGSLALIFLGSGAYSLAGFLKRGA